MDSHIFINISLVLTVAIVFAFLAQMLRQPLLISYLFTGIACGPLFLGLVRADDPFYGTFAKFGVILLLFLVGLGLNFDYLRQVGKAAVVTGVGQVVFTAGIGIFLTLSLGYGLTAAAFLAVAITFSSTIIITKLLTDKREHLTVYGRNTIGLMLVQDLIAIAIMILLPTLARGEALAATLLWLFLKITIVASLVYFLARLVLPRILERAAQSTEFLLIFTLAWCFAIAGLAEWGGLSLEVGAIVAGLSLGSTKFRTEIHSRVRPLRDFFIAVFFIILGSQMDLGEARQALLPAIILSLFILIGNPLILYILFRRLKFTRAVSFLSGLTAAQVSEFGFVLLFLAAEFGYGIDGTLAPFTLTALITIFISTYLITHNHRLFRLVKPLLDRFGPDRHTSKEAPAVTYEAFVIGYHRLGWKICDTLKEMDISFAVVDFDPMAARKLEARNIPFFFGDATETDFLEELPLDHARLVISTMPLADDQLALIEHIRRRNTKAIVIANLAHAKFMDDIYAAGADYVMMPHLLTGQWIAEILRDKRWTRRTFKRLTRIQREELKLKFAPAEAPAPCPEPEA